MLAVATACSQRQIIGLTQAIEIGIVKRQYLISANVWNDLLRIQMHVEQIVVVDKLSSFFQRRT